MLTMTFIGANRDAWGYLLDTVATEHTIDRATSKADYYMAGGTPAGVWAGRGIHALNLGESAKVEEAHLVALFGAGTHPITGAQLGRQYHQAMSLEDRVQARVAEALTAPENPAETTEDLHDRIYQEELAKPQKQSVAGFEIVFSPPKSVSSWWAIAEPDLKDQIRQAHHAAIQATIDKLETDYIRTRTGADGVAQQHIKGITAALFDHWDSRDGDPQLHTHMLVSNRVQGEDGRWRTIDSRWSLSPAVAAAGVFYDTVLMDELSQRFGVQWSTQDVLERPEQFQEWLAQKKRADTPAARHQFSLDLGTSPGSVRWQIDSVPAALNQEYSSRAKAISCEKDALIEKFVAKYGKQPSAAQVIKIRQQATYATRRAKRVRTLKELTQAWRDRARPHVGDSFLAADRIRAQGKKQLKDLPLWSFRHDDVNDRKAIAAAEFALHNLANARSTWTVRNAETEALRAMAGWRFRSAEDRNLILNRVTALMLERAVALTPKNHLRTPAWFHTAQGENMFHPRARDLFTTREVWEAEERLLVAGRSTSAADIHQQHIERLLYAPTQTEERTLSEDQAAAVRNICESGRLVDVLVGPAGAGKTTSLEKLRELWEAQHGAGSVRGLAPTARAAEVLADSLGIQTENTAKWIHETNKKPKFRDKGFNWNLRQGDLLIIDEASIAGTLALDQLRAQADEAGAKLLLVGDWAQLAAVDAGGAFGLLASDRDDVAELHALHRFTEDWEAEASKLLRLGKTSGLTPYIDHGRISWGLDETIIDAAVDAWKQDEATLSPTTGRHLTSLLIAPTNDTVERLNTLARQWRINQGDIDTTSEATIAAGVASPGDRIVTRQNARHLRTDHDRWVKNNDEWIVVAIDDATGDIIARAGDETVTLPATYCRDHVQLGYATTAHRAQGRTVDTAHTIVDSSASRETFYVAMTRGRSSNRAYVVIDEEQQHGDSVATGMSRTWRETLDHVVLTRGGDIAAHDTVHEEAERIGSIRQLAAEYQTLIAEQLEREYLPLLGELGLIDTDQPDSPYLGPVLANLRRVDQAGDHVPATITKLLEQRDLGDARDVLAVLHYRLGAHLGEHQMPAHARIAGLIEPAPHVDDVSLREALRDRAIAIQLRAEHLVDVAITNDEPWLRELGVPIPGTEEAWRARAVTVACYRDLYGVDGADALGRAHEQAINRGRDRAIAEAALEPQHVAAALPAPQPQETQAATLQQPGQ